MSPNLLAEHPARRNPSGPRLDEAEISSLAQALRSLAQESGHVVEEAQVRRLLADLIHADPGAVRDSWWRWLLSAARSLGLSWRVADVPLQDLPAILKSGACVAFERSAAHDLNLNHLTRGRYFVVDSSGPAEDPERDSNGKPALLRIIVLQHEGDPAAAHHHHAKPWVVLWQLLSPDRKDMFAVAAIAGVAGLLLLSIPVTAQHLVRTVTFATLYQPIIVLSLLLLGLLGFVAALHSMQIYVAEIIQRRLFVRIASKVSRRLIQADLSTWHTISMPELVNRFLEIAIVQKVTAALLVDGITIALTTLIGMSVMAFYHPFLLGYDLFLLGLLALIFFGFGRGGVKTAIVESRAKYGVLGWLEDIARCPGVFRTSGVELLAMQRTDRLCAEYLHARRSHFSILMRQIVLMLILQAIATTALLGLGGLLVLREQLTLGQLVAAELIVTMIVASFAKLGKHLEGWYDLLAAVDKLTHMLDLQEEPNAGLVGLPGKGAAAVSIRLREDLQAQFAQASAEGLQIARGTSAALLNWPPKVMLELLDVFRGSHSSEHVGIAIDGINACDIRPDILRSHVSVVAPGEFLMGTIAENIHLVRPTVSEVDLLEAAEAVGLISDLEAAGFGLSTQILPSGYPLNAAQCHRLIIARGLIDHPRTLYVDFTLDALSSEDAMAVWRGIKQYSTDTTLILATVRNDIAALADSVFEPSRDPQE